jgi:hypothetical protein
MPDTKARMDFLKKSHLFRGLNEEQLKNAAERMKEITFAEPEKVFSQGATSDFLYLIFQGQVDVVREGKKKDRKLATLTKGDYFGEQGLLTGQKRNATVKADKGTILLLLSREYFKQMLRKIPGMRQNFELMVSTRKLATQQHFKWLAGNEVIYFIARKHKILLVQSIALPVFFMVLILALLIGSFFLPSGFGLTLTVLSVVFGLADGAWLAWKYIDWGNDFYILTNQRVIWLEKVVGLYDSRNEAGIHTILSVSTESNEIGRFFDFGTVVVRTFTGHIRMEYIRSPMQASAMIEEYWMRTKEGMRAGENDGVKQAIRAKLGYAPPPKPATPPPPPAVKKKKTALQNFQAWWAETFKVRMEVGGNITYRKHVVVLFQEAWLPTLIFIGLLIAPIIWTLYFGLPPWWVLLIVLVGMLVDAGFWVYEYIDWSNDLYQVTADQIVDINRKPFGEESRKSAPLDNILGLEYKRDGIWAMLFNYGTVFITVGGTQFNFEQVADPPAVLQDIRFRQQARAQKKKDSEGIAERDKMIEWLALYHRTVDEIQREQNQAKPKPE